MRSVQSLLRIYTSGRLPLLFLFYVAMHVLVIFALVVSLPAPSDAAVASGKDYRYLIVACSIPVLVCVTAMGLFSIHNHLRPADVAALPPDLRSKVDEHLRWQSSTPVCWGDIRSWGNQLESEAQERALRKAQSDIAQRQRAASQRT